MKANSLSIEKRYWAALEEAERKLSSLDVACGRPINLKGLRGWVFEQTVRTCLEEELKGKGIAVKIREQVPIGGRATVDLLVGSAAIEVKAAGFFDDLGERYRSYRRKVEAKGWHYFYLTRSETYKPYVQIARKTFGKDRAFFLDQKDSWPLFVSEVVRTLSAPSDTQFPR